MQITYTFLQKRAIYLLNCLHKWEKKSSFALGFTELH